MFLVLAFHNHQPVGQLPWLIEEACDSAYAPFLDALEKHPQIRVALHFTGPLLDWLEAHRPQLLERLRVLAKRGQIEILGGAFYEPILALWPFYDQLAQLEKMSARVEEFFGETPRGAWLAERIWEPQLAQILPRGGVRFTFIDDNAFRGAGVSGEIETLFRAEDSRGISDENALRLFPINSQLRELLPWKEPARAIEMLRAHHEKNPDAMLCFADDGEKFGAWPGTHDWVFTRGWLDRFFVALEENTDWLHTVLPCEYSQQHDAAPIALPASSYQEMQNWSRGDFRNFLERYPESRDIFQEIIATGEAIENTPLDAATRDAARDFLLRAQSNDAFWHGVFGGLYLRHLRQAAYANASRARVLAQEKLDFPFVEKRENAVILQARTSSCGVRESGGFMFSWTSKVAHHNLLATLRRHEESYLPADAPRDWHARGALHDHFFGDETTPQLFQNARYEERGDFCSEAWQLRDDSEGNAIIAILRRDGNVWSGDKLRALTIEKRLILRAETDEELSRGESLLQIEYVFSNREEEDLNVWWSCEWNLAMSGHELPERHYHAEPGDERLSLNEIAAFENVTSPIVGDRWLRVWSEWFFEAPIGMWHVPIRTVSQKEGGAIEETHQSSAFVFHRRLCIPARSEYSLAFRALLTAKPRE